MCGYQNDRNHTKETEGGDGAGGDDRHRERRREESRRAYRREGKEARKEGRKEGIMQNNEGEIVDLYIPRKWYVGRLRVQFSWETRCHGAQR